MAAGAGPGVSQPLRRRPGNPLTCPLPLVPGRQSQLAVITIAGNEPPTVASYMGCPPPHTHTKPTPAPQRYHPCLHPRHLLVPILTSPHPAPQASPGCSRDSVTASSSTCPLPSPCVPTIASPQLSICGQCLAGRCHLGDTMALFPTWPPQKGPSAQRRSTLVLGAHRGHPIVPAHRE